MVFVLATWLTIGTTTGISAHDRALTARMLADPSVTDGRLFTRPGHIFPLRYHEGGVLKRAGHTEASVGEYLSTILVDIQISVSWLDFNPLQLSVK